MPLVSRKKTSKHYGVCWDGQRWKVQCIVSGVKENLGRFDDELQAAKAVDKRLREVGQLKNINYDDDGNFVYAAPNKSSQYQGVSWDKCAQKWQVRITVPGGKRSLGLFVDEAGAARAYDAAARELAKPTNF